MAGTSRSRTPDRRGSRQSRSGQRAKAPARSARSARTSAGQLGRAGRTGANRARGGRGRASRPAGASASAPLSTPSRGRRLLLALLAVGAGLAVAAAFPPVDAWWAAVLGVALLELVLTRRGGWAGAGLGLLFGAGMFTPLLRFTADAMGNPLGWAALTVVESLYLAALGAAWALVSRLPALTTGRRPAVTRVLAFTVLWCGVEELRSSWPWGGFPFGRLAFAMADAPVLSFAAYGGSVGVTALVALAGACLAEAVLQVHRGNGLVGAPTAVIAACAVVLTPLALPIAAGAQDGTLRVGAVQGNVAHGDSSFAKALEVTANHAEATEELADATGAGTLDVVIWPENAADRDPRTDPAAASLVEQAAQAVQAPILVGAVPHGDGIRWNDEVVWTPGQGAGAYYRKHRPVPFGEYVPLRSWLRTITTQVDRIGVDMLPGTGPTTLTVHAATQDRDVTLAMGICFEVVYDDTLRSGVDGGGEAIIIPTNNASFGRSSEAAQQLAQGRVQAVVHGRSVVQVSTVGITAIISPKGTVLQQTRPYTRASLVADVDLRTSRTVADVIGSWPGILLEAGAGALALAGIVGAFRARGSRRRR